MASDKPLVSIGVPTYNRPKTLKKTLECLVNQTYSNIEIIVSDNCSTDEEVNTVINSFIKDTRVKYFKQEVNKGAIFNFNFILEKATGEFFMRLADDDWIDLNYVESCLNFLLENRDYSGAYGYARIYNSNNEFVRNDPQIKLEQKTGAERVINYLQRVECNGTYYGLIRKSHFPYLKTERQIADDWLVVARVIFLGKYKMVENANSYITTGGISTTLESITQNLNLHSSTRYFPYLSISLNVMKDIIWNSAAYRKVIFWKRIKLALVSFKIIFRRFNVKSEIKRGIKRIAKFNS